MSASQVLVSPPRYPTLFLRLLLSLARFRHAVSFSRSSLSAFAWESFFLAHTTHGPSNLPLTICTRTIAARFPCDRTPGRRSRDCACDSPLSSGTPSPISAAPRHSSVWLGSTVSTTCLAVLHVRGRFACVATTTMTTVRNTVRSSVYPPSSRFFPPGLLSHSHSPAIVCTRLVPEHAQGSRRHPAQRRSLDRTGDR